MTWTELGKSKYLKLTSFKKDGTPVGAPVWAAADGDRIVVWTSSDSWKVKRIRRNPEVRLQVCDARGKKPSGDVVAGLAEIQEAEGTERTRAVIGKKYGVVGTIMVKFSRAVRGKDATVGISIALKSDG